jgi:hypothetical protein
MELFAKLFSSRLVFIYHRFDRIVIHGYLSELSRAEQSSTSSKQGARADGPQRPPDHIRTLRDALSAQNEGTWSDRAGRQTHAYRLTSKGTKVALTFVLFHQRLYAVPLQTASFTTNPTVTPGPTANWKPPTTTPTRPSATSSNYLRQLKIC